MDFLLNDQSDDESQYNEEIKKRLLNDIVNQSYNEDELSHFDQNSVLGESILHNFEPVAVDHDQSQTWLDFMKGNEQRDLLLHDIEQRIQQVKIITQGGGSQQTEIEVDDDYEFGKKTKMKIKPLALRDDQIQSIKKHVQDNQPIIEIEVEKQINDSTIVQNHLEQKAIPTPTRFQSRQQEIKINQKQIAQDKKMKEMKEQIDTENEQIKMEQEDQRSQQVEAQILFVIQQKQFAVEQEVQKQLEAEKQRIQMITKKKEMMEIQEQKRREFEQVRMSKEDQRSSQVEKLFLQHIFRQRVNEPLNQFKIVVNNLKVLASKTCLVLPQYSQNKTISPSPKETKTQNYTSQIINIRDDRQTIQTFDSSKELLFHLIHKLHLETLNQVTLTKVVYLPYKVPFTLYENMLPTDVFQVFDEPSSPPKAENKVQTIGKLSISSYQQSTLLNLNTKKLEIKLEGINTLEGIEQFQKVNQIKLSSNNLTEIGREIQSCQQIIEINFAQNQICKYDVLGSLKNLRVLILEMNLITKIQPLKNCTYLELYNLNGNQITKIENLDNLTYLKRLILFKNSITSIGGLNKLCYLEELDLGSNQINKYETDNPFLSCYNLRKLYLYNNNLVKLPQQLRQVFLTSLWIQQNGLTNLNGLQYLPSLQHLFAQDNQLTHCVEAEQYIPFMPQLQKFNVSRNKLTSFGSLNRILKYCDVLEDVDYRDNPFLDSSSQNVLQLQQFIMMRTSLKLNNMNEQSVNRNDYEFLASKFNRIIDDENQNNSKISQEEINLQKFITNLRFHNDSMNRLKSLSERKLFGIHEFVYTEKYRCLYIQQDITFINNEIKKTPFKNIVVEEINKFDQWHKLQTFKVRSFLIRWIYYTRRRNQYYKKNIKKIIITQSYYRGWSLRKVFKLKDILFHKRFEAKAKFASKIQKAFRTHLFKRRRDQAFQRIKYVDKEIDDMEDFDDDFFSQPVNLDYDLIIPKGVNIGDLFQAGMQAQQQQQQQQVAQKVLAQQVKTQQPNSFFPQVEQIQQLQKSSSTNKHSMPQINQQKNQQTKIDINKQMINSKYSDKSDQSGKSNNSEKSSKSEQLPHLKEQNNKKKEQVIMDEWGFTNPEVAKAFAFRLEREKQRKDKAKFKNLNADQRLQRFHKNTEK